MTTPNKRSRHGFQTTTQTHTPIKRFNTYNKDSSSSSNDSGDVHASLTTQIKLDKEPNTKLRIGIYKQPPTYSFHRDFIKKEIILPDNPSEIDMAYFSMVKTEIDICLYIESLRKLNKTNKTLLSGIITTFTTDSHYNHNTCILKQVYGGEQTLNTYLTSVNQSDQITKEHKYIITLFLYLQCLFVLMGLHHFKIVHNDIHLDNILLKCKFDPSHISKIIQSINSVMDVINTNYNNGIFDLEKMLNMLNKYSPYKLLLIDFDRAVDDRWDEKQSELFQTNLYHIMDDHSYDLSAKRFCPENDIITLTSRFGVFKHKISELVYLNRIANDNKASFKKWGDPPVIRLLRRELSRNSVITIDSAIKRTLKQLEVK